MSYLVVGDNCEAKFIKKEPFETCFVVEPRFAVANFTKNVPRHEISTCHLCKRAEKLLRALYKHIQANHPDDGSETMKICSDHCAVGKMIQAEIVDHLMSLYISSETTSTTLETCEECTRPSTTEINELATSLCPGGMKHQSFLFNHFKTDHITDLTLYNEQSIAMTSCFCTDGLIIQTDLINHLLAHLVGINDTDWIKQEENCVDSYEETEQMPLEIIERSFSEVCNKQVSCDWQLRDEDEELSQPTKQQSTRNSSDYSLNMNEKVFLHQIKAELERRGKRKAKRITTTGDHASDEHYLLENRRYFCKLCSYVTVHKKRFRTHWEVNHDNSNPDSCSSKRVMKKSEDHPGDGDFKLDQNRYHCRLCSYVCDSKQRHRVHWETEHDLINAHLCAYPSCSNRFQTAAEVEKHHLQRHLGVMSTPVERKIRPKAFENAKTDIGSSLKCEECSKEFPTATKLRLHLVIHRDKSFLCDICGFKAYTRAYIKIHMGRKHLTNFICGQCDESFSMKSKLNEHEKAIHSGSTIAYHSTEDNQFVCDQPDCGRAFADKNKLKQHHENVHSKVICDQCSMLVSERHLERHMQSRHGYEKPFKCEISDCKASFIYRRSLSLHMNLHAGIRPFQCEYCSKAYVSKNSLAIHLIQHVNPNKHRCEICQTNFTTGQGLRSHLRLHSTDSQIRPYSCNHPGCNKSFKFKEHVRAHYYHCHTEVGREKIKLLASRPNKKKYPKKKKGNGQRKVHKDYKKVLDESMNKVRYLCEFEGCGRNFSDKRVLESHINSVHFGIKGSFICEVCSQSFATQKSLKVHQPIHLDYDSFSCKFCGKGYKSKSSLIYHEGTHTGNANRKPRKLK